MLGFLDNLFLKLEGKEPAKKSTKKHPAKRPSKTIVPNYNEIKKPIEPDRIGRKTLNTQKLGLGSLLYHFLVDKSKAGLDGWKDDKEKFKTDLLNDIKTFLFGKWEKPWSPNLIFNSNNKVISGFRGYNGNTYHNSVNILTLSQNAGESPYFIALKRLKKEGGTILNKDKVCSVLSYIPIKKEDNPEKIAFMLPMAHKVINLDYVDGVKKPKFKTIEFKNLELNEYVENFIKVLKATRRIPKVIYDQADQAYYISNPPLYTTDEIHLVNINQFKNIGGYYSTLFHEIIHSTKNPKRLGRGGEKTKNLPYANEELVAEMGAMILCSELGLEYGRQNSLTYLNGWLKNVKGDPDNAMLEAYAFACDAVEYLIKGVNFEKLVPKSMQDRAKETVLPDGEPTRPTPEPEKPATKETSPQKPSKPIKAKVLDKTVKATAQQAVTDLMQLPKYKKIGAMVGTIIFKEFKDDTQKAVSLSDTETFKLTMFKKAESVELVESNYKMYEETFTLTDFGREFINAVKGRLNTLHGKKYMNPLFGLAGINEVNEQFNHELDLLINGKLPENHVFYMGDMSDILSLLGIKILPIEMQANRLLNKSKQENHTFTLDKLNDLPEKLNNPIFVFKSKTVENSLVVLTELTSYNNNFVAAIELSRTVTKWKKGEIQINDIRSIYPKDTIKDVLNWIEKDNLLLWCNISKSLDLLAGWRSNYAKAAQQIKRCTKIIQNFENRNTPLNGVKARKNEFWTDINGEIRLVALLENGMIEWDDFTKGKCRGIRSRSELFKTKKEAVNYFKTPKQPLFGLGNIGKVKKGESIKLKGDLGAFLGGYERKNYSIVLRGDKGAGKSRLMYQIVNLFASEKLKGAVLSLEMAKDGSIATGYRDEYINPENLNLIDITSDSVNYEGLSQICKMYDFVAIDSWTKLKGMEQNDFDRLQKENPQTIIIAIFQSTTGKVTRGGNMPEYDGSCVIHVHKGGFAECEKNRYNATDKQFNVFQKKIVEPETAEMEA